MFKDDGEGGDDINGPRRWLTRRLGLRYVLLFFFVFFIHLLMIFIIFRFTDVLKGQEG
jgi:hypothetical protein